MTEGDCFERAYRLLQSMGPAMQRDAYLCHGSAINTGEALGEAMGHAWVEVSDTCLDYVRGQLIRVPVTVYYAIGKIERVHRYTIIEARAEALKHKHYGPWAEDLWKLRHR